MSETKHDLLLRIKASDGASGPLAAVAARLKSLVSAPAAHEGKHSLKGAFKEIGVASKELGKSVLELGAKFGELLAIGGGIGFVGLLHGAIEAGSELDKMSKRLGVTATWYATMSRAAEMAEVTQEEFSTSLTRLSRNLGEAQAGTGTALAFLQRVSPVLAKQFKGAKSTAEAFTLITKAVSAIPDPARRTALTLALMGKGAVNMAAFMGQGTAAVNKQAAEMFKLIGAQGEFAEGADEAEKELKRTKFAFEGLSHAAAQALFPALTKVAEAVREFFGEHRNEVKEWAEGAGKAINEWVRGGGLKDVAEGLGKIAKAGAWVVDKLGLLGVGVIASAPLWAPLASAVWGVVTALGALVTAAGLPLLPILALGAAITAMYLNWDKIKGLPLLKELDTLLSVTLRLTKAIWALREASGGGKAPGAPVSVEQGAQQKALDNVGGALKTAGYEAGAGLLTTAIPGLGLVRGLGQLFEGIGNISTGAAPRGPADTGSLTSEPAKAEVLVSFSGAPAGTRMSVAPGATAEVDLSMGPTMAGP